MPPAVPLHFDLDEESLLLASTRKKNQQQQQQRLSNDDDHDDQDNDEHSDSDNLCYSYWFGRPSSSSYAQQYFQRSSSSAETSSTSLTSMISTTERSYSCYQYTTATPTSSSSDDDDEHASNDKSPSSSDHHPNKTRRMKNDEDHNNNRRRCCGGCWNNRIWLWYYTKLQSHPVLVKSLTAFVLMIVADLAAQTIEQCRGISSTATTSSSTTSIIVNVDWERTLRFGIFGLGGGYWTHYYYYYLDTWLPPTSQPWTWTTFLKVFLDQFIQAPIMLALIIMGLACMEGKTIHGILDDMKIQYMSALLHNWTLWIPATIINMAFVAPSLRVGFDNLIFFGWTIYLSMFLNKQQEE